LIASTTQYHFEARRRTDPQPAEVLSSPELLDAHLEIIRLSDLLESKKKALAQCYEFLQGLATTLDSQKVYYSVLKKFSEIMQSERGSLMLLNEESNELALEATVGAYPVSAGPIRMKLGEGIAGAVLASGSAMLVHDVDSDSRVQRPARSNY